MKRFYTVLILLFVFTQSYGQDSILVGKKYFEDQFYARMVYNVLLNKPENVTQKGLSLGLHTGYIKDIPLSENGKIAIGIGLGYAYDKFQTNFRINELDLPFQIIETSYDKNKFETHAIEIPLEFRFRTSTDTSYKFWRLYIGGHLSYVFSSKAIYKDENETQKIQPTSHLNSWQYGPHLSIGYNAWNVYAYWNANAVFKNVAKTPEFDPNQLGNFKIGMQFYIF